MNNVKVWRGLQNSLWAKFVTVLVAGLLITTTTTGLAQNFNKIIPMRDWAEPKVINYSGSPVALHVRTGYQRGISFPEPITLYAVNNRLISAEFEGKLPGCKVDVIDNVLAFSPLQRMQPQTIAVRGNESGTIYELLISSSPIGSRHPIKVQR